MRCVGLARDLYERLVAKCVVEGLDILDIGEWMVSQGWAVAYYQYSYEYSRAEQRAKSARRGMWAGNSRSRGSGGSRGGSGANAR